MVDIFRERKDSERNLSEGGFKDVRNWQKTDITQMAMRKIAEVEAVVLHKQRLPYCSKCAINMVEKKIENINKNIRKHTEKRDSGDFKIDFDIDYEKFGGEALFDKGDDSEIEEDKLLDGIRQRVVTGKYKNYICKTCGNHLSMEFKTRELETTRTKIDPATLK